jgi:hypothetical protein
MVARLNLEHFRRKLAQVVDEATREMITRLIAEEEAKLAVLNDPPAEEREKP